MGIFKTGLKIVGSAALGVTGVASSVIRKAAYASGNEGLAEIAGSVVDKSFNTISDMWTPDEKKTEDYYNKQDERSMDRAEMSANSAQAFKREYDRAKVEAEKKRNNG